MYLYSEKGSHELAIVGGTAAEDAARARLSGKVMIAIGDSYTAKWPSGGGAKLEALAAKYGMIFDNRGVKGATICVRPDDDYRRLYKITDTVVSDYTNGKTISGTAYYADDVAVITFMGGANDDPAPAEWIGDGLHNTENTLIYGSLNHIFSALQETFTNAKIICITQPANYASSASGIATDARAQALGFDSLAEAQEMSDAQITSFFMFQKETAVYNCAVAYGLPIVDMFHEFPSVHNPENRSTYWANGDALHLSQAGYAIIANAIDRKIVELFGQ